jgi:hypothetical protein
MMHELLRRAEQLARTAQIQKIGEIAQEVKELFRAAAVEIEGANVIVSGRGLIRRWLIDPSIRFLSGRLR